MLYLNSFSDQFGSVDMFLDESFLLGLVTVTLTLFTSRMQSHLSECK